MNFDFDPEASCKDYRAWYGLGQTYEILKMPYYSLYYYNEAYKLRLVLFLNVLSYEGFENRIVTL